MRSLVDWILGQEERIILNLKLMKLMKEIIILADYTKEDIRWNSLWNKIRFDNLDEAKEYCEKLNIELLKLLKADI